MGQKVKICSRLLYDVSVKSINCVCARTNKQFILIDTPNTENEIKWCEHASLWEFEVFEDCGNCIAMEQSGYISEWQNLLLTPLIPNCYVLCTPAILKTFVIRSFFFKKWLLTHVFGGSQVQKSSCKQACNGFMTF